jgi:hypothetical protein
MHNLLHLVKCFKDFGGLYVYSQWALESKLGVLRNYAFRRSQPEIPLVNNVLLLNQLQLIGSIKGYTARNVEETKKSKFPFTIKDDSILKENQKKAIASYLITQMENVPLNEIETAENGWLEYLKNPEALREIVTKKDWLKLKITQFKRMNLKGNCINSVKELYDYPKTYNSSFVRVEEMMDTKPTELQTSNLIAVSSYYEIQIFIAISYLAAGTEYCEPKYDMIPVALAIQYEIDTENQTQEMKEMELNGMCSISIY